VPLTYGLKQNYPNPFNPTTNIEYQLPVVSTVTVKLYDVTGREIRTLVNQEQKPGFYKVAWDGTSAGGEAVSSGIYFYRIDAVGTGQQSFSSIKKMMLLK
jgi:flagellar hook assembly protein FlgD